MPAAPTPDTEAERLESLQSYDVLDTACEATFDDIARLAAKLTGSPIALVSLVDRDRQWFKAQVGLEVRQTPREQAFCAHAILDPMGPLLVPDARLDPRFADNPLVTDSPDIRFYAGVPLRSPEGHALGTLCVMDRQPRELSGDQLDTLVSLAGTVTTTLELRRAMRRVEQLAMTDALTGLPNRPALLHALGSAIARQRRDELPFSLLYLDLDGLKRINDVQGHGVGDAVLRVVATCLRGCLRREDVVARLGGDEFAAVLNGGDGSEAALVAERARLAVKECMEGQGWPITVSVGALCFLEGPDDDNAALAMADELMYMAKRGGRNRVMCRDHRRAATASAA